MSTEIISVIPAHLDPVHVRWLATLADVSLTGLKRRAQRDLTAEYYRGERHRVELEIQSIEFVQRERGPLEERIRAASAHEDACVRELLRAQQAERQARLAVEAAVCARLKLEGLEQEHAA